MRIVRYRHEGSARWGVLDERTVMATVGTPFVDLEASEPVGSLEEVELLAPVEPRSVLCIGRNYADHAAELGNETPERPLLFTKPASSIIGPGGSIVYPRASQRVDHEGELVVVIGTEAHEVGREDAWSVIGGYTVGNDVTARDIQKDDPGGQWTRGKGFVTFCPIGPWVDTAFDPTDVRVTCTVDGELRQDGRTSDFTFDIPTLIEYITSFMRLDPGDLIMTGTPAGVGPMDVGSQVSVEVEGLGVLTNEVVAPA